MSRLTYQGRRCTGRDTAMALLRATVLFGAVAVVTALVVQPDTFRYDRAMANGPVGIDPVQTGSVGPARAMRIEPGRGPAPCLEFPDGSRRGAC
jgi:hypothetical protein